MTTYYQFVGGNLSGQILARKEVETIAHGRTKISQKKGAKGN